MRQLFSRILLFSGFTLISFGSYCQEDPYEIDSFPFIDYNANFLTIFDGHESYDPLFGKLTQIGLKGEGKVSIVHMGDSHLQADFFSGYFRKQLQTFFLGAMGGRGFIFPYKVAGTNNPLNYAVSSEGRWESCRNVERKRNCSLGLSGIAVITSDSNASIKVTITDPLLEGYDFDRLMIFHTFGDDQFEPVVSSSEKVVNIQAFPEKGYTLFEFNENLQSVTLMFKKTRATQIGFTLYGMNFDSNDSGIIYHTIGVNGAQIESYLSCDFFVPHMAALAPDWVIVSLGTNDSYTYAFDSLAFSQKVDDLIGLIKEAAPNSAVLFTTPGDHRMHKGKINPNASLVSEIIKQSAKEHRLSYWDFNKVMGGKGSVNYWHHEAMASYDYLHLTQKGYEFQSKLLFTAFLKSYDDFLAKQVLK
jgi:hypothetical protein